MSQAATARANGAKSNGPITAEGKAISSQNSLKHGLTSSRVVLPHESQEAYDKLEASLINRFKPADDLESEFVQEMAAALEVDPAAVEAVQHGDARAGSVSRHAFVHEAHRPLLARELEPQPRSRRCSSPYRGLRSCPIREAGAR